MNNTVITFSEESADIQRFLDLPAGFILQKNGCSNLT